MAHKERCSCNQLVDPRDLSLLGRRFSLWVITLEHFLYLHLEYSDASFVASRVAVSRTRGSLLQAGFVVHEWCADPEIAGTMWFEHVLRQIAPLTIHGLTDSGWLGMAVGNRQKG